ncbi:uncharacterized protein LOC106091217 [Stomoxys calcitrans]|uniref:uncharacterized protein LOC106091217 n=1 Tax=Stomoxys calcitrans TaxID=35570 RepID=UPI0027E299FC|nr:uncharacterized protein LOC106091217 [Stomoxys calcitrans]
MRNIRDIEPSTCGLRQNVYHLHLPLFVLDAIRLFQDHPQYVRGLKEADIVNMLKKESFACGDIAAQVKNVLKELTTAGFVRYNSQGYRTLGPFAKLGQARTQRQFNMAWEHLKDLQSISCTSLYASSSSHSNTCG